MVHDLRHALRRLRLQPGYATAAVLALALGIGCTTAIFSVLQAVLLRTLPLPHSERLVNLSEDQPQAPDASLSAPDVLDLKEQVRSFESVSVAFGMRLVLTGIGYAWYELKNFKRSIVYFDSALVAMPTFVICACFSASINAINFCTGKSRSGRITTAMSGLVCFSSVSRAVSAFKSIT